MEPIKTKVETVNVSFGNSIQELDNNVVVNNPQNIINQTGNSNSPTVEDYNFDEELETEAGAPIPQRRAILKDQESIPANVEPEVKTTANTTVADFFDEHGNNSNKTFGVDQHILANLTSGDANLTNFNINDVLYDQEDETKAFVLFLQESGALSTEEEAIEYAEAISTGTVNTNNVEFISALILYIAEGSKSASQEEITNKLLSLCDNLNQNNKFNFLLNKLKAQGFSEKDATYILQTIDVNVGVCTYAASVNAIFAHFMNDPEKFEETFGFPMFDEDGTLNGEELLLELFMFANSVENGGNLFVQDPNDPNKRIVLYDPDDISKTMENQLFLMYSGWMNEQILIDFIASKESNLTFKCASSAPISDGKEVVDTVQGLLNQGKPVVLTVYPKKEDMPVFMTEQKDDGTKGLGTISGGHAVFVTGITEDGHLIISSWGKEYIISAEDLNASNTTINAIEIVEPQPKVPILMEREPRANGGN